MTVERFARAALDVVRITPKTRWVFVTIEAADGAMGCGEATLQGREAALHDAAERLVPVALAATIDDVRARAWRSGLPDLADAAILSALDAAVRDLGAQRDRIPLAQALGGAARARIPIYANINRRTTDRSPAGFARSAGDALAAGFTALKIAPFDEVDPARCAAGEGIAAMRAGLERVAAVRAVAGAGCRLMVDCHWRFDEPTARALIDAVAELAPHWVECPLPETSANIAALVRLRARANAARIRLAGLEVCVGWEGFRRYCEAGAYDVAMPDVKYVGGLDAMMDVARKLADCGVEVSPHNPSGPIAHAASLHVAAAVPRFDMLELQYDESPLFDALVGDRLPPRIAGASVVATDPGLGVALERDAVGAHAEGERRVWRAP